MIIQAWDKDTFTADDLIGEATVTLGMLANKKDHDIQLFNKSVHEGVIKLRAIGKISSSEAAAKNVADDEEILQDLDPVLKEKIEKLWTIYDVDDSGLIEIQESKKFVEKLYQMKGLKIKEDT